MSLACLRFVTNILSKDTTMGNHFFVSEKNIQGKRALLDPIESKHLCRVMRKKTGDSIRLLTGRGKSYEGKIISTSPQVEIEILSSKLCEEASSPLLVLCPAILKNNKMDWLIEKATELGVHTIIPFQSEHGVVQVEENEFSKKITRWERLAQAALKQSGRTLMPQIGPVLSFEEMLQHAQNQDAIKIIFTLENIHSIPLAELGNFIKQKGESNSWFCMIGPEGGFSSREEKLAQEAGFKLCSLGVHTLRAETAGLATLAILKFLRESLS